MLRVCVNPNYVFGQGGGQADNSRGDRLQEGSWTQSGKDPRENSGDNSPHSGMLNPPQLKWHLQNRKSHQPLALYHPYDVSFIWDNRVAVVEGFWPYSRIQLLDQNGKSLRSIGQGEIQPFGIAIDSEGYMAVTDHKERTVKFFTMDDSVRFSWKPNMFDWPEGIDSTAAGKFVVTDWMKGRVSTHDMDSRHIQEFSSADRESSEFSCPSYVTIDKYHRIILTDTYDHTVKIFDQTGKLLLKFGGNPLRTDDILIKDPRGVTTDPQGNIIVADWGNNAVLMYSNDGRFIQQLLTGDNGIKHPWGVRMDNNGQLLVSEQKRDSEPSLKLYQC